MLTEVIPFCRQTVTVEPRSGIDKYGVVSYGTAVTYAARVSGKRRLVRNEQNEQVLSTHTVHFVLNPVIGAQDRITLSTGDVNSTESGARQPLILNVGRYPDDLGGMTTVVYLA